MVRSSERFVFLDPRGKRWPRLRLLVLLAAATLFVGAVLFVRTLLIMPQLTLPASVRQLTFRLRVLEKETPAKAPASEPVWLRFVRTPAPKAASAPRPAAGDSETDIRMAFTVDWDPDSHRSFASHAGEFTHVCPEWFTLVDGLGTLVSTPDPYVRDIAAKHGVILLPLLRNLLGDAWQPEAVESLANGPAKRRAIFIDRLLAELAEAGAAGVVIDWGQVDPAYAPQTTMLLRQMAEAFHAAGRQLWLCVPMGRELRVFDLEQLSPWVDRFIAMLHDENGEEDAPGPLASQEWFEGWLGTVAAYGKPSQWVTSVGSYGYDWTQGGGRAEAISFDDVMSRAGRAGLGRCQSQTPSANPRFDYENAGKAHTVWFLDAATFLNHLRAAHRQGVGGFAVSRLGTEDPGIWEAIRLAQTPSLRSDELARLNVIAPGEGATHVGNGEFLTVEESRAEGLRRAAVDAHGRVTMDYERFPLHLTVCHQGRGPHDAVALTFDDGPDAHWTPQILDILKAYQVKAAFFMVGTKMEKNPDLVRRIKAEGHEVGVHTYTHPNLAEVSDERVRLELNATQRLIESLTGHSTVLFRPPYNADARPENPEEISPLLAAQELGYLAVSNAIDSKDWLRPGAEKILGVIKAARNNGNVILLHDAGGNRRQTVEALPLILDWLRVRGDRVVSLGQLLGVPPEQLMPVSAREKEPLLRLVAGGGFGVLHLTEEFLWAFMIVAGALVLLRSLTVAVLAAFHRRGPRRPVALAAEVFVPPVSVLMPAYNEEKVIRRTLAALLATDYPGKLEVVVVDDGSTDATAAIVGHLAQGEPRLRLIRQPNQGKAVALQTGMAALGHEIIVTLDADTQFAPQTIGCLVAHFRDERVAAVSGHARVGNLRTFIARCQEMEYICGFNLDRRAYHQLDCITVVPGAVGALRRTAVLAAGGVKADTLAEDTDLTLSLHRLGWRVAYEPQAIAWTEAPESVRGLLLQRFRWAFGTLQCLWKHRDLLFQPRYGALGFFSLPSAWFFQILLVALAPAVDALLIFSLLFGSGGAVWSYFLLFLLMDFVLAVLACGLEGEPWRRAWVSLPMRMLYRPLLSWVVWKSILEAIKGAWVGWGKIERATSINFLPQEQRP
jgi:cellulose synthase/poly-beta-1,6-N-acetylglucosamine synthase-like glycosyltransferase/peptidoglycan/xylan/chitin deacetylase (PgdA/CDA1 family)/spore germination protein YaaH